MLKEQYGYETVVMIGDGATDLEACPPAVSVAVCQCKKRLQCDYSISPFILSSERFHWIWRECRQAAGQGEVFVVCDEFWGATERTGEDLKVLKD